MALLRRRLTGREASPALGRHAEHRVLGECAAKLALDVRTNTQPVAEVGLDRSELLFISVESRRAGRRIDAEDRLKRAAVTAGGGEMLDDRFESEQQIAIGQLVVDEPLGGGLEMEASRRR